MVNVKSPAPGARFDVYETTMCMYEVLKAGGLSGGFNFVAKNRRLSYTAKDMFYAYILGMDAFALGLLKAAKIIEDGRQEYRDASSAGSVPESGGYRFCP